jgi:type I restriction enzyme M protein
VLKDKSQFCCWKYEERSGRKTKVPYNPVTGKRAKPNQRGTFKDFSSAVAALSDYDGMGFLVGNDICVIDLDDCFDSSGKLKPIFQSVVEAFSGCYMEHSPSEKGLHIFFKATGYNFDKTKYYINNRKLGVEVYVSGATNRFVTVTGNVFANGDIPEKSNELQMILDKYMLRPTPVKQILDTESQSYLSDKSVIEKALKSANGEKFKALWEGDTSGYASASEADLALCGMLAFWCGRDIGQMDRLFRQSGLMRDKWNRPQSGSTYGMITIVKAIANATEIYKPGGKRSSATEDLVKTKGFFILPSELFENVRARAKDDENLNETLEQIFSNIEASAQGTESEDNFKGLFDDIDVNSNKLGNTVVKRNEKLVKLMNSVGEMKLGDYKDNTIDAFGDAYEFLMGMYASNAGKSGGEYYTPQEVSELLTHLTLVGKTEVNKVYDPACGSGSLLLKFAKILGKENVRQGFFGQEINITTYNLCRINMFLHDIDYDKFDIALGDTLTDPQHWDDEPFEAIVSNPPYSIKWKGDNDPILINDPRFSPAGVLAPKSKADLAFIMHSLSWLATNGTAAIVCFPGVMYRGGAEKKIRQYLIDNNYIDCIIQLPDNLFYGTSIATCIMVLKKSKSENSTLFIDASKEFVKVTNNNKLTQENIETILNAFKDRKDIEHFARLVPNSKIAEEDYNLSVSTYVEQEDTREKIDIVALNAEIEKIVAREQVLREEIDKIIAEIEVGK